MENQQPYPMPEIRIQMRLNIITDGGELSMGPNGQVQFVQPPPPLPAIKSTPRIQQIDSSGDERKRRHHHKHHKHSRDKESGSGSRHSEPRSRHRDRDDRHRHERSHRASRREGPSESDVSTSTVTTVQQETDANLPYIVNEPTPSSLENFGQIGFPGPTPYVRPSSRANFSDLEPLDNEVPQELSFNQTLVNPPVVITQEQSMFGSSSSSSQSRSIQGPMSAKMPYGRQDLPSVHQPGHYRSHQKGLPDESLDSLEVSLDNRFAAFQERLSASNPNLNNLPSQPPVPENISGSRVQLASGGVRSHPRVPSPASSQHTLANDVGNSTAMGQNAQNGSLSGTVKTLLASFEPPEVRPRARASSQSSLTQPAAASAPEVLPKPIPKPRQFGSYHSLHSDHDGNQLRRSTSQRSLETTFPAEQLSIPLAAEPRPTSPSVSLHSSNFSYPEFARPGILKKAAVPPVRSPPAETTFGVEPLKEVPGAQDLRPSSSGSRPLTPSRSREDIEQELAPLLSNIESRMRGLFSDQDNALKATVNELSRRVDATKNKEVSTPVREEEIKNYFQNLESKLANMIAEREKSLSTTIQGVVQTSALQSKVDALEKESQMKFLERRLEHLFTEKETAFKTTVESLMKEFLAAQQPKSPSPPPAPEPKQVQERIVRDELSPRHYIHSQPYAAADIGPDVRDHANDQKVTHEPLKDRMVDARRTTPTQQPNVLNYSVDSDWSQNRHSFYDVPTPVNLRSPTHDKKRSADSIYEVPSDARRSGSEYNIPTSSSIIPRPGNFGQNLPSPTKPLTTVTQPIITHARPESSPSASQTSPSQKPINKASSQRIFDLYTRRQAPSTKKHVDSLSSNVTDSTLMEENFEDYLLKGDHFSPPTLAVPESASLSREDSLSSVTSLRADRSAPFYDVKSVRFREDDLVSDIDAKLRQQRGSVASTATTYSDVGIALLPDEMSDTGSGRKKVTTYEETTVVEQVEYFRTGKNHPAPPELADVRRSDSSASTNTISGYGQVEVDASRIAKTVYRPDTIALLGHLAQSDTAGIGRQQTTQQTTGKSPTKPTEL